jgi:hypothetical protein
MGFTMKMSNLRLQKIESRIPSLRPIEQYPAKLLELRRTNLAHSLEKFGCNASPADIDQIQIEILKDRRDSVAKQDASYAAYLQAAIDQLEGMRQKKSESEKIGKSRCNRK